MRKTSLVLTAALFCLALLSWLPAAAQEETTCRMCDRKVEDGNRKFSVSVARTSGMESSVFDDIGCAVAWRNGECAMRQSLFDSTSVTRDYATGEDVAMEKAYFVIGAGVKTPRGYDIVAFREKEQAERFAAKQGKGKVLKLFELVDVKLK